MKHKEKRIQANKGITLIALVVTIVVLIILATVSINAVLGQNGIIGKAKQAKESYEKSVKAEDTAMQELANEMAQYDTDNSGSGGGSTKPAAGTTVTKPGTWTSSQVTPIADGNGGTVPLPNGFYYVGGDINTGLVISDKQNDTLDASGTSMGNQFVWIPVASEDDLQRTNFDTNGQPTTDAPASGASVTDCTEPYASGYSTEASEYNTMRTQVLKYGGFYIGRFEAGVNSTTLRTGATTAQTVVCKKGVAPYNYVPWGTSMSDASEISGKSGAVYLAKNFANQNNYTSVTSTLIYGCQWDAMCRYIGDAQRTTPKKSTVGLTGSIETDVSKNIYDLAGNCYEWTMEGDNSGRRVLRGGNYHYADPVCYRSGRISTDSVDTVSFRPTLYIK